MRVAPILLAACAVLGSCIPADAAAVLQPPPRVDQGVSDLIAHAMDGMEAELAANGTAHPDLFPKPPENTWRSELEDAPLVAFDDATHAVANQRLRLLLEVPDGENHSRLSADEMRARLVIWNSQVQGNASRLVAAVQSARVPTPGAALENVIWRQSAVFYAAGQHNNMVRFLPRFPGIEDPPNMDLVLPPLIAIEACRVAWTYLPPTVVPVPAGQPALTGLHVRRIQHNVSYAIDPTAYAYDGNRMGLEALLRNQNLAALGFTVFGEMEFVKGNSSGDVLLKGSDLRPRLVAEYERVAGDNSSLLAIHAEETAYRLLSITPESDGSAAKTAQFADALAQFGAVRLMRGLPVLHVQPAAVSSNAVAHTPGAGIPLGVAALGLAAYVAGRRTPL